jgi:hypothetical protein
MSSSTPIDVFIAYAKADSALLERLRIQLSAAERIGLIDTWHDGEIEIGTDTQQAMEAAMNKAKIILLLISADFFASEVYEKELPLAMTLHQEGKARVLPIILRECTWQMTPIAGLKVLPPNGVPVTSDYWTGPDQAFRLIVEEIIRLSSELRGTTLPSGTTTITQKHQEHTKTVIEHQSTGDGGSTSIWKQIVMGLVVLLILGYAGWQLLGNEDKDPIAQNDPRELPVEEERNPQLSEQKKEPVQQEKAKPVQRPPQSPAKAQKTEQVEIQAPQPKTQKENPPAEYNEPAKTPKTPSEYRLSNNTLTDLRDNQKYPVIKLNGLTWMGKNLTFNAPGSKCFGNVQQNCEQLGALYHFDLAQQVCPEGWRLPTMSEWMALNPAQVQSLRLPLAGIFDGNGGWLFGKVTGFYWTSERSFAGEARAFRISQSSSGKESRYTKWSLSCRCVLEE